MKKLELGLGNGLVQTAGHLVDDCDGVQCEHVLGDHQPHYLHILCRYRFVLEIPSGVYCLNVRLIVMGNRQMKACYDYWKIRLDTDGSERTKRKGNIKSEKEFYK